MKTTPDPRFRYGELVQIYRGGSIRRDPYRARCLRGCFTALLVGHVLALILLWILF